MAVEDERGRHIGNIMYYNHDSARREAELGISIGRRDCWAQGYGTDAVAALVTYLFRETDLQRLYLHTLDWNKRAHRAFEKAGFADCGSSWRNGSTFIVMEVRREWVAARAAGRGVRAWGIARGLKSAAAGRACSTPTGQADEACAGRPEGRPYIWHRVRSFPLVLRYRSMSEGQARATFGLVSRSPSSHLARAPASFYVTNP